MGSGSGILSEEGGCLTWRDTHLPLLVELVTHFFREILELAPGLHSVGVGKVLEVAQAPAEVLKPLNLLEVASDLSVYLAEMTTRNKV